ncbi:Single-strand DNA endonuclease 1-like protein [Drosera capensis]
MGVKNLWDILESCKKTLPLHYLQGKRVCIDLSCWMVQLHSVNKSHCSLKEKLYLKGLFHRLRALIALNCCLIFVTDGSIPAIKVSAYRRRLNPLSEIGKDDTEPNKASSLRRNAGSEFSCMIKEAKALGLALGIPCLDGIEEAEAQCALLNSESLCDGCFSSDSDVFLFGARIVYRDICLGEGGYIVCYEMDDIENKLGFGRNSLIALALLLGSDYSPGVHGFGPETACPVIRSAGEDTILQHLATEGRSYLKKMKTLKKQGQVPKGSNKENCLNHLKETNGTECGVEGENEFTPVITAYLEPKCHAADSEPVYRALAVHPFQRTKLHEICAKLFDWTPEKTDEYILPKIAERDLRRFTKLRSVSSELGALLPLDKMPVKRPVSKIIKPRRLQGRECYEVLWEGIDGLKTSIVPADLVQSACPERITEYNQRVEEKKQKPRKSKPKQLNDKPPFIRAEIDHKLKTLSLDIESDHQVRYNTAFGTLVAECTTAVTQTVNLVQKKVEVASTTDKFLIIEENMDISPVKSFDLDASNFLENEVIDLLSPSPQNNKHGVTCCQGVREGIEVVDLCDSDMDISPEHLRKARDLRMFLNNIRKEIS